MDKPASPTYGQQEKAIEIGDILLSNAAKEIKSLTRQLAVAVKTLEKIRDHEHCDGNSVPNRINGSVISSPGSYARGHKACSTIATEGLAEMERVK